MKLLYIAKQLSLLCMSRYCLFCWNNVNHLYVTRDLVSPRRAPGGEGRCTLKESSCGSQNWNSLSVSWAQLCVSVSKLPSASCIYEVLQTTFYASVEEWFVNTYAVWSVQSTINSSNQLPLMVFLRVLFCFKDHFKVTWNLYNRPAKAHDQMCVLLVFSRIYWRAVTSSK